MNPDANAESWVQVQFNAAASVFRLRQVPDDMTTGCHFYDNDRCMATLDNILNNYIEATHPTEERVEIMKKQMQRIYCILVYAGTGGVQTSQRRRHPDCSCVSADHSCTVERTAPQPLNVANGD